MKRRINKAINNDRYKKQISSVSPKPLLDVKDLLKITTQLGVEVRKAENFLNWQERCNAILEQGRHDPLSILKAIQITRDAGSMDKDIAFCKIFLMAEWLSDDFVLKDQTLEDISAEMSSIEKYHGLSDNEFWRSDDPDVPEEWKALNKKWAHHHDKIIAAILKQCGENEIADLFINNRESFNLRFETGRCKAFKGSNGQMVHLDS